MTEKCWKCDGTGRDYVFLNAWQQYWQKCPRCNGTGEEPKKDKP